MIKIIDLYSGNPRDFTEALSGNFAGVIFKAGQGDWLDVPEVQPDWWKMAGDKGLLRGWYWVCDSRYHSSKHIDAINRWRDASKLDLNAELGFWSDVEYPYFSMTSAEYWKTPYAGHRNVVDFHYLLAEKDIDAGLYSADGVYNEIMKNASGADHDYLSGFRLWPANYPFVYVPGVSKPRLFGHWKTWTFWQYRGNPDYNEFNGTDAEFVEIFGGQTVPPTGETTMYEGTCIYSGLRVRTAPVSGAVIGSLNNGDKVKADRIEGGWWHLVEIRGVASIGWAFEGDTKGYIRTDAVPTDPPSGAVTVQIIANGVVVHEKQAQAGSVVKLEITD